MPFITRPTFPIVLRAGDAQEIQAGLQKLGFLIPKQEVDEKVFGPGTREALLAFQRKYKLQATGSFDEATKAALAAAIRGTETDKPRVEGRLFFDHGLPAADVVVRLYQRSFGPGDPARLDTGEHRTDTRGFYAVPYELNGKMANIEVRVVDAQGKETPLSATNFKDADEVICPVG